MTGLEANANTDRLPAFDLDSRERIPGEELAVFCDGLGKKVVELSRKEELTWEEQDYILLIARNASNFMALSLDDDEVNLPSGDDDHNLAQKFTEDTNGLVSSINSIFEHDRIGQISLQELTKIYPPKVAYSFVLMEIQGISHRDIGKDGGVRGVVEDCTIHVVEALGGLARYNKFLPGEFSSRTILKRMAEYHSHIKGDSITQQ